MTSFLFSGIMADVEFNFELLIGEFSPSPAPRPPRRTQLLIRPVNLDLESDEEDNGRRRLFFDDYVNHRLSMSLDSQGWDADSDTTEEFYVDLADTSDEDSDADLTDVEDWEDPAWIPTDDEWIVNTPHRN